MKDIKIQLIRDVINNKGVNGYLDIKESTDFPLTFSVADIRDITKRKGAFSKTIKLSGSKNNNKLLNNYFDVNVIDGTFNINTLQKCIVLEDNVPILENGYIQLISVNKVQSTNRHDQLVEYEVIIKDDISDFFTKLGNSELSDIKLDGFKHTFSAANVVATFGNDVNDVYKYVMPGSGDGTYNLQEWLPGVYAKVYWDKIFANAGYTYDWSSLTSDDIRFDKLIIPYNGDFPQLSSTILDELKVIADINAATMFTDIPSPIGNVGTQFTNQIIIDNEIQDDSSTYDPVLGEYTSAFQTYGTNVINAQFTVDYSVILDNTSGATAYLQDNGALSIGTVRYAPMLKIYKNGVEIASANLKQTGNPWITKSDSYSIPNGQTPIDSGVVNINIPLSNIQIGDIITTHVSLDIDQAMFDSFVYWRNAPTGTAGVRVTNNIRVNDINMIIQPSMNQFGFGADIDLNNFIPLKVKQTEFIKSIITMFNLFIDVDKTQPNKLIISTRDDYYDSGANVNWTKKLNKEKDQNLKFLPELTTKKIKLTYKEDTDLLNKGYKDNVNEIYSQQDFTFDNEYIKGEEVKQLIFSPTPVIKTSFNAIVPSINGASPKMNIRILYDGGIFSCNSYDIIDYTIGTTNYGQLALTTYPLFSHLNHPTAPTYDISFGINDYYFYGDVNAVQLHLTNNNLYNLHWRRTLNQINKNKMLIAYFDLNSSDIHNMKLNDKIRIDNSYWNINKVIDYNANKVGPTKVELMSIDDELKFSKFKTRIPKLPVGKGDSLSRPVIKQEQLILLTNSVITSPNVTGTGRNNVIGENVKGFISGDNNTVYNEKSMIIGDNNTVNSDAIVFGSDNVVEPNLQNVQVFGNDITATESDTLYANNIEVTTINNIPATSITTGLPGVLNIDNTTSGNDIVVSAGDKISDNTSNNYIEFANIVPAGGVATTDSGAPSFGPSIAYNISPVSTSGVGTGLVVRIGRNTIDNTFGIIAILNPGLNFEVGDTISFIGTQYGLATPANDITYTILSLTTDINSINIYSDKSIYNTVDDIANGITDTISIDPQQTSNGTGIFSNDGTKYSDVVVTINGISILNNDTSTSNSSSINLNSEFTTIQTQDGTSYIFDRISTDPQFLTYGTGIISENSSTYETSKVQVSPNRTSLYSEDASGPIAYSRVQVEPTLITIESTNINIPILPTGTPVNNVGIDAGGNLVIGTTGGGGATWGSITGTLSAQTDLQTALNGKQNIDTIATVTGTGAITNDITLVNNSAAVTVTLPTAVGIAGKKYTIKAKNNTTASNNITIATTASQTIDTVTTYVMRIPFESITVVSDGTAWFII